MTPLTYALMAVIIVLVIALYLVYLELNQWKSALLEMKQLLDKHGYVKLTPRGKDGKFKKVQK